MQIFSSLSHLPLLNSGLSDSTSSDKNNISLEAKEASAQTIKHKNEKRPPIGAQLALNYFVPQAQNNRVREGIQNILQRKS